MNGKVKVQQPKKYYLAGPMTGYSDWNIPTFKRVRDELTAQGYNIVLPADLDNPSPDHPPTDFSWWLGEDVKLVLESDGIIFLEEWERSRGACIEAFTGLAKYAKDKEFEFKLHITKGVTGWALYEASPWYIMEKTSNLLDNYEEYKKKSA